MSYLDFWYSSSERKRRQVYRSDIHGQLPFETRGMDVDPVPTIDFSSSLGNDSDSAYSLERADVDGKSPFCDFPDIAYRFSGLLHVLDDLEELSRTSNDGAALSAVRECKASLDKLVAKMDGLESGFDRIAERSRQFISSSKFNRCLILILWLSVLSASRVSQSRRRCEYFPRSTLLPLILLSSMTQLTRLMNKCTRK